MDSYAFRSFTKKGNGEINRDYKLVDCNRNIAIIADGISNCNAGMQAAYHAVSEVYLQLSYLADKLKEGGIISSQIPETIHKAIIFTNDVMNVISKEIKSYEGWGTTLDCCLIHDGVAYLGHVGDSKVYYLAKGSSKLEQLTRDNVILPPDINDLPQEYQRIAAMFSPLENHMGANNTYVDLISLKMKKGDILLLTTDGLTKIVSDAFVSRNFRRYRFLGRMKAKIVNRLNRPSQFARLYSKFKNIPLDRARYELIDDATFVAIRRVT